MNQLPLGKMRSMVSFQSPSTRKPQLEPDDIWYSRWRRWTYTVRMAKGGASRHHRVETFAELDEGGLLNER